MILSLFIATFLALCLLAALIDFETLTIPNWLNGWMAFLFIPDNTRAYSPTAHCRRSESSARRWIGLTPQWLVSMCMHGMVWTS